MAIVKLGATLLLFGFLVSGCPTGDDGASIGQDDPSQAQLPQIRVNLPPSPSFQKDHPPEQYTDSSFSIYGLKKKLKDNLEKELRVKGFIIEVYECPPCPKKAECKTCIKPHFWLADRANGSKEDALMVVDYPKEDEKTRKKTTFDIGTQYFVRGTFSKSSGTGFSTSDGLLVYAEANRITDE